jgi:ligand-binding SRPBCC domain-containing protein
MTEITHVKDKEYFVDEQRVGPYSLWHHQHKLTPIEGGVLMTDIVTYQPPFGFLGAIANTLIIKSKLKEIFDYRTVAVEKRFGKM